MSGRAIRLSLAGLMGAALSSPAAARVKLPPADEILRRVAEAQPAYEGHVVIENFAPELSAPKELDVHFLPPGRYRREMLDDAGKPVQLVVSDGTTEWIYDKAKNRAWSGAPPEPLGRDDESDLLEANYTVVLSTGEAVAGRKTWLLQLRSREDRHLDRRLWVDRRTDLVLRSQAFQIDGAPAAEMHFEKIRFTKRQKKTLFKFSPPAGAVVVKRLEPDYMALDQAKSSSGLEPRTPSWLPSGYVFQSLDILARGGKNIIHYRFSDGINVLSLFQCPPHVTLDFGGKEGGSVALASGEDGTLAWTSEGRVLAWSSGRSKFMLVGAVSTQTLKRIAESIH